MKYAYFIHFIKKSNKRKDISLSLYLVFRLKLPLSSSLSF